MPGLAALYMRYGIADGMETAKQLVRRIEDMAAAQARAKQGISPG